MEQCKLKLVTKAVVDAFKVTPRDLRRAAFVAGVGLAAGHALAADLSGTPASTAATTPAAAQDSADQSQLDQVVVTARKSTELLQDVPVSITAIKADTLIKQNMVSLRDFFAQVPGLTTNARGGGRQEIALRGIVTGFATNPTTATVIDDTPFGASTLGGQGGSMLPDLDPFDLQRIEVLRGPQGTLYGANSLGGLIKYVTIAPNTAKLEGRVEVDGSKTAHGGDGYGERAALNVPLSDTLAMRVSVFQRQDPGFINDPNHGAEDVNAIHAHGGRLSVLWNASDDLTIRASALSQSSRAASSSSVDLSTTGAYTAGPYAHSSTPGTSGYNRGLSFYDLNVGYDMKWATLTSVTSSSKLRFEGDQDITETFNNTVRGVLPLMGMTVPSSFGVTATGPNRGKKVTQEVRLESPADTASKFDWRTGLYYTKEDNTTGQAINLVNPNTGALLTDYPLLNSSTGVASYKEYSAFGTVTYHFTPQFDLQTGGRYSHNKQDSVTYGDGVLNGGPTVEEDHSSEGAFTYMVTPRYRFSEDLMTYATLSSGYRPGGANSIGAAIPATYKSDSTVNLELGVKGQFLNRQLSLNAALFHIKWKDLQLMEVDPATSYSYYTNSSGAKSEGLELSSEWRPLRGLAVTGSYTLTHAVLTADAPPGVYGYKGDRLPYSAKQTGTVSVNQNFPVTPDISGFAGATLTYMGDRYQDFQKTANTPRFLFGGFSTVNLQAGVQKGTWTLNAFAKNVGDKLAYLGGGSKNQNNQNIGTRSMQIITPRTVGVALSTTF